MIDFAHAALRELTLFAATGLLIGAFDELLVDLIWIARAGWRRIFVYRRFEALTADKLEYRTDAHCFAVFVPAWDEAAVIGPMLDAARRAYARDDVHIFVGCYPNDMPTIEIVRRREDRKLSLVDTGADGPTTKAHCLNQLYRALEVREARSGKRFAGVILHDAEDIVSASEARIFDRLVDRFGMIQLPVVPLPDAESRWISGHYCDEFAESHAKTQLVREALGAALPAAGVGCMIRRDVLDAVAADSETGPFAEGSLTEDYELGLRLGGYGFQSAFVRIPDGSRFGVVATQAHFPATFKAATCQKARWMAGIGLAGWDRLGWGQGWAENWMRLRDRRGVIAAFVLCAAYAAALLFGLLQAMSWLIGTASPAFGPTLTMMLELNSIMLVWRLVCRALFVTRIYGWREGLRSIPRSIVANIVSIAAARRAVLRYLSMLRLGKVEWDKTSHKFPDGAEFL